MKDIIQFLLRSMIKLFPAKSFKTWKAKSWRVQSLSRLGKPGPEPFQDLENQVFHARTWIVANFLLGPRCLAQGAVFNTWDTKSWIEFENLWSQVLQPYHNTSRLGQTAKSWLKLNISHLMFISIGTRCSTCMSKKWTVPSTGCINILYINAFNTWNTKSWKPFLWRSHNIYVSTLGELSLENR